MKAVIKLRQILKSFEIYLSNYIHVIHGFLRRDESNGVTGEKKYSIS